MTFSGFSELGHMILSKFVVCADRIITETMVGVPPHRRALGLSVVDKLTCLSDWLFQGWDQFVATLKLDERLEFNQGDIGLAGGVQVTTVGLRTIERWSSEQQSLERRSKRPRT